MMRLLSLDDFDMGEAGQGIAAPRAQADVEEARLEAFEEGYSAGWEDACRSHAEDQARITMALGRSLQEMSFTYHEAQAALVRELEGVLSGLVSVVLPATRDHGLAELIKERALALGAEVGAVVEVSVAPENVERVQALTEGQPAPPMRVVGEETLSAGQACLRFGAAEERIDLDAALAEIRDAVAAFAADDAPGAAQPSATPEQRPPNPDAQAPAGNGQTAPRGPAQADARGGRPLSNAASAMPSEVEARTDRSAAPANQEERRRA